MFYFLSVSMHLQTPLTNVYWCIQQPIIIDLLFISSSSSTYTTKKGLGLDNGVIRDVRLESFACLEITNIIKLAYSRHQTQNNEIIFLIRHHYFKLPFFRTKQFFFTSLTLIFKTHNISVFQWELLYVNDFFQWKKKQNFVVAQHLPAVCVTASDRQVQQLIYVLRPNIRNNF